MAKVRTKLEQQAYEARMKWLKQSLEHEALPPEGAINLSEEESDRRLSNRDLKILRRIIQIER